MVGPAKESSGFGYRCVSRKSRDLKHTLKSVLTLNQEMQWMCYGDTSSKLPVPSLMEERTVKASGRWWYKQVSGCSWNLLGSGGSGTYGMYKTLLRRSITFFLFILRRKSVFSMKYCNYIKFSVLCSASWWYRVSLSHPWFCINF